ncbi:MAG: HEAT repeat domain-containing protein, partial [Candidatus Brocadiia bacterium]
MKRLTIGLIMMAAVVLCSYEIASAPCCPPPPILTNPGRTLPKRRSSAPPRTYYTGAPTTLRTFYDPYSVYEETWVDWVNENSPYFLAQYEKIGDKAYVSTVSEKDVVKLLALLSYRGTFEKGVHRMAVEGIKALGKKAEDTLIAIAQGKYALDGETTAKHLNRRNYEWLAVIALGMLEGERVKRELEKIALGPVAEPSGTFLMGKKEDILSSLTRDGSREKKFWACISLGRSGDPACAGTLREVVESERDEYIRCAAAEGLSFIAGQKSIDGLRAVADPGKSNYHLRAYVSAAMGLVGSADPIRGITDVVDNAKDPDCRGAAGIAMAYLIRRRIDAGKDFRELADQYAEILWFEKDASAKRAMGLGLLLLNTPEGFESFKMFLSNPRDADLRCLSALAAGLTGSADAAAYLAALAPDADPIVEKARAYAMAMLCAADPRKLIDDLLSEENELLEGAGVFLSLRYNGDKSWRLVDDARFRKSTPFVQRALALSASAYCTTKGLVLAKQLLSGREQWGRADALVGLGMRGDVPALDMVTANVPPANDEAYGCYSISMALMSSYALISGVQASGTDA